MWHSSVKKICCITTLLQNTLTPAKLICQWEALSLLLIAAFTVLFWIIVHSSTWLTTDPFQFALVLGTVLGNSASFSLPFLYSDPLGLLQSNALGESADWRKYRKMKSNDELIDHQGKISTKMRFFHELDQNGNLTGAILTLHCSTEFGIHFWSKKKG